MSPISDKTRKILWARSGNRCAICRHELVVDATEKDALAIVGEECHIISAQPNGPRHDPSFPKQKFNSYENLILLCRIHHKMVDDQEDTFTARVLGQLKSNHESWISERLTNRQPAKPLKLRRIRQNIPSYLARLTTGKEVLDLVLGACAFSIDYDELNSQQEVDLVGQFLQDVSDWSDISDELEPSARVSAAYSLTQLLKDLEEKGFCVFGAREVRLLEGGIPAGPSDWPIAIIHVLRKENSTIIHLDTYDTQSENPQT
jgi:hypothetical protein